MRQIPCALGLAAIVLLGGCHNFPKVWQPSTAQVQGKPLPDNVDAATLVTGLNANASRLQSLQVNDVIIDARQGGERVGLSGIMNCQKPKNFRLVASVLGSQAVDLGSNDQEFWYWISKADPPALIHCSYQDLARGGVYVPFPFQPDWVLEALGMAEYDPAGKYTVRPNGRTVELIQQTTSVQGQPVYKVTVFDKLTTVAGQPSVIGHQLLDANGKEICSARVTNAPPDKNTGAVVPRTVTLAWPSQKIEMTMKLDDVRVNGLAAGQQLAVFQRPQLRSVRDIDLAHLPEDLVHPTGGQVQRVRGSMR